VLEIIFMGFLAMVYAAEDGICEVDADLSLPSLYVSEGFISTKGDVTDIYIFQL
jgi:hypothetical protein